MYENHWNKKAGEWILASNFLIYCSIAFILGHFSATGTLKSSKASSYASALTKSQLLNS